MIKNIKIEMDKHFSSDLVEKGVSVMRIIKEHNNKKGVQLIYYSSDLFDKKDLHVRK